MKRAINFTMVFVLLFTQCFWVSAAQARMITNEDVVASQHRDVLKQQVLQFMDRDAARQVLLKNGVDRAQVSERLDRLSTDELQQLADNTNSLPAGEGVVGLVIVVFLVLILLDLLGVTDIFPAIHAGR